MPRAAATKARKQATQERSRATVEALLAATARVLVREGYDRASTNKIAAAAGVSVGSLYQYFPSKEALVAAVQDRHVEHMLSEVRATMTQAVHRPLPEAARELVRVMIAAHAVSPKLHRVLVEQIPRVRGLAQIERVGEEALSMTRVYLGAHASSLAVEDLEMAAFIVVTCVEALTHAAVLYRPALLGDESFVDEVTAVVIRYLGYRAPEGDAGERA